MLDGNKHIDSLFADKLKELSVQPDPKVWNGINSQLAAARRKKRLVIYITSAAMAACLILLFSLSNKALMDSDPADLQLNTLAESKTSAQVESEQEMSGKQEYAKLADRENIAQLTTTNKPEEKVAKARMLPVLRIEKKAQLDKWILNVNTNQLAFQSIENQNTELPNHISYQELTKENLVLQLAESLQVQKNLLMLESLKKDELKQNRWAVIGQVSSEYSNENSSSDYSNGLVSFGGGVKVNYALNKKLAIQTGIKYNQFGQEFGQRSMTFAGANLMTGGDKRINATPQETPAGPIKLSNSPELRYNAVSDYFAAGSTDMSQNFETIEVPLLLRYNLMQKKVGLFVTGGMSANWIIENAVYSMNGGKRKIGEVDDLRTTNFSSHFGLGVEYSLSSKLRLGLEPSFKYYINSISKNSNYNYKPYSIGIQTGIRYNF